VVDRAHKGRREIQGSLEKMAPRESLVNRAWMGKTEHRVNQELQDRKAARDRRDPLDSRE